VTAWPIPEAQFRNDFFAFDLSCTRDKKFLGQVVTENRTSSPRGPAFVNRLHDFLGPPHCVCDCAHSCRNSFSAVKLSELAGGEDTRCDQQHTLPPLVQWEAVYYFRFLFA
jgi:hypothetical protein